MPSHMPTYYGWAKDRPCTTNAVYGYTLRSSDGRCTNCSHYAAAMDPFPGGAPSTHRATQLRHEPSTKTPHHHNSSKTKPINRGYVAGYVPVTQKVVKGQRMGVNLLRTGGGPEREMYGEETSGQNGRDTYLWHALSGTLVHCKNPTTQAEQA